MGEDRDPEDAHRQDRIVLWEMVRRADMAECPTCAALLGGNLSCPDCFDAALAAAPKPEDEG